MSKSIDWEKVERLIEEIIEDQKRKQYACGKRIVPTLTPDDMLQPNDFEDLEVNPHFRYEEGVLAGLQTLQMALRALKNNSTNT